MAKIQTEITISLEEYTAEAIKKITDNQVKILELTAENSNMLCNLLKSRSMFKTSDNRDTKELPN